MHWDALEIVNDLFADDSIPKQIGCFKANDTEIMSAKF